MSTQERIAVIKSKPLRLVRPIKGPPFTGVVVREDVSIFGEPIFVVYEYGYSLKEIAWRIEDCRELPADKQSYLNIDAWLSLVGGR